MEISLSTFHFLGISATLQLIRILNKKHGNSKGRFGYRSRLATSTDKHWEFAQNELRAILKSHALLALLFGAISMASPSSFGHQDQSILLIFFFIYIGIISLSVHKRIEKKLDRL